MRRNEHQGCSIIAQGAIAPLRTCGATSKPRSEANPWLNHVMQIFSAFIFASIFTILLISKTKRKTLEDLAGDWDARTTKKLSPLSSLGLD
jgi:PHS family inorganic phosphate transporter-like MFS transporter